MRNLSVACATGVLMFSLRCICVMKPMYNYSLILRCVWCVGVKNLRDVTTEIFLSPSMVFKGTSEATRSLMRPYCFLLTVSVHLQLQFACRHKKNESVA